MAETSDRTLAVAVTTPEGAAFDGRAVSVVAPAFDGEVAFLPGHAPFVGMLGVGELRVDDVEGGMRRFYLSGGVVQVADGQVVVLAESVRRVEDLDAAAARAELEAALAAPAASDTALDAREARQREARTRLRLATAHAR